MADRSNSWLPPALQGGASSLASLSPEAVEDLRQRIAGMPAFSAPETLEAAVQDATDLSSSDAEELVRGLFVYISSMAERHPDFAARAKHAVEITDLPLEDRQKVEVASVIAELLEAPAVRSSAKAYELLYDQGSLYGNARFITELRPIFGEDHDLEAMTVFTTLRIRHFSEGETRELRVAVNEEDLAELRKGVLRAIEKTTALNEFIQSSGLVNYRFQDDG